MTPWTDDELMALLGEAGAEADAVTDEQRASARAAFSWRTVDSELMELLHDSSLETSSGSAVRAASDGPRALEFGRIGMSFDAEVDGTTVLGQVSGLPGEQASVTLQRPDADDRTVDADASGFFRLLEVGPGLVRFTVSSGEARMTTPWVTL